MARRVPALIAAAACLALAAVARPEDVPAPKQTNLVELGRRLFFEPTLSRSGTRSCASCHDPDRAFADSTALSLDDGGHTLRTSQTLLECTDSTAFHSDGEFHSIEALIRARIDEVSVVSTATAGSYAFGGPTTLPSVLPQFERHGRYAEALRTAPGTRRRNMGRITAALTAYIGTLRGTESPYDRFAAGDEQALSPSARRGLDLFRGAAGCVQCHRMDGPRATFTDGGFHDTGIAWRSDGHPASEGLRRSEPHLLDRLNPGQEAGRRDFSTDVGRRLWTRRVEDNRKFKTPTLRDVAKRGPYTHDGSFARLEDVVRYYADGCSEDPDLDPLLHPFEASDEAVEALVDFLKSLSGDRRAGLADVLWSARAQTTTVTVRHLDGKPAVGIGVVIQPAGDPLPGHGSAEADTRRAKTDGDGKVRFTPPAWTHVKVSGDGVILMGFDVVLPDTCRAASVVIARGT